MPIDDDYTPLRKRHKSLRGGGILHKGKLYWWVGGHTRKGRYALYGPCDSQSDAEAKGQAKGLTDCEAFQLSTRNENKATRMVRARRMKGGADFDDVLDNMEHR